MEEEKFFDLRDRFALAAMRMLLSDGKTRLYDHFISGIDKYPDSVKRNLQYDDEEMGRIAQISYRIADIMRKARLAVFE